MQEWKKTVLSQYDNSTRIKALLKIFSKCLLPETDIKNFFDKIFNIGSYDLGAENSLISAYGLDVWANIVAIKTSFVTSQPISGMYEHVFGTDDKNSKPSVINATPATMSVICRCYGVIGTVLTESAKVADDNGVIYTALNGGTIGSTGYIDLFFTATDPVNNITAPQIGDITTIYTQITGWTGVINVTEGSSSGLGNFDNKIEILNNNSGGTFAREQVAGNILNLAKYAARRLILLKALANISNPSLKFINSFVYRLFYPYLKQGDFIAVYPDTTMSLKLATNFVLSPYLKAVIYDSGILPIPVGVNFTIDENFPRLTLHAAFFKQWILSAFYTKETDPLVPDNTMVLVNPLTDARHVCLVTNLNDVPSDFFNGGIVILQQ